MSTGNTPHILYTFEQGYASRNSRSLHGGVGLVDEALQFIIPQ